MDHKTLSGVRIKSADKGEVTAVFATFNVKDKDGDVTLEGAFTDGAEVVISSYGHASWQGALPVGKGRIRTTKTEAILEGQFFLDTTAGRETFAVVKQLGARQQWSYSLMDVTADRGKFQGEEVQFLKRIHVDEVSPVLVGAGVNTRTLAAKAHKTNTTQEEAARTVDEYSAAIRPHDTPVSKKSWDFVTADRLIPEDATVDDLRAMHAYVDPAGDPTVKSSYDFMHHDGPGGSANLRACFAGIGRLVKGDHGLSDVEAVAVYNHLAAHLDDGDLEPPEMRSESGILKQNAELAVILADWQTARARVWETRKTRALKGKALGATTVMVLDWIAEDQRETRALLDTPSDDAAREYARFIQSLNQNPGDIT